MTEERKHAILFAATLLCARKLIETMESDKPNFGGWPWNQPPKSIAFLAFDTQTFSCSQIKLTRGAPLPQFPEDVQR